MARHPSTASARRAVFTAQLDLNGSELNQWLKVVQLDVLWGHGVRRAEGTVNSSTGEVVMPNSHRAYD
jgi:hypothetical protein